MLRTVLAATAAALAIGAMTPASAQSFDDVEFKLTPYIWIAWPEGDIETESGNGGSGNLPPIHANFDDVSLSGMFTGSADVRFGRFGAFGDLSYYEIEADKDIDITGDVFVSGQFDVSGLKGMLNGYYRFYDDGRSTMDVLAGIHYVQADLDIGVTTPNRTLSGSLDEDWWDPVIGVRGEAAFTDHFGIEGFAFYGGFGVNSDELYDLFGALNMRFNNTFKASLGWRWFADKFSGDRLDYETSFSGPLVGLEFTF
jgi:hypothetical protein